MQDIHIFIFIIKVDVDGSLKYSKLTALAKYVLCISHGNSDPETGFSLNKTLSWNSKKLSVHGALVGENIIEAVRSVLLILRLHVLW